MAVMMEIVSYSESTVGIVRFVSLLATNIRLSAQ